jgi:hypothetical protein
MIRNLLIFLILLSHQVSGQEEKVFIDSSGVIIVKHYKGKYLDLKNWSCIITSKEKSFESNKSLKNNQENLIFLYPYDFDTELDSIENYTVVIKKEDKIIFEEKVFFEFKPKGKYQLLSNHTISNKTQKKVRGEIIDSYYFETTTNKHEIIRSVSDEKRIYFYYLIDDKITNIHTDIFDYSSLSLLKNPILITDLNDDLIPEITLKYTTETKAKTVFFSKKKKFICRKEKEEITFSPSLNELENCFYKQYLINETNSISE